MPTLADIRAKLPDLQGLDDEQAISVIQQVYYPTVPVEQIAARLGYKPASSAALPERTKFAAINDTVIEAANIAAGGVGSIANFVAPGNRVSSFIDENIVKPGQESQSDRKKAINARLAQDIAGAQGVGDQVGAALRYAKDDPAGLLGMAAGSFAIPLGAIKGAGMLAKSLGVAEGAATKAALAGGALTGAALSGGDAAGQAYEESLKAGATEEQAQAAARQASVIPAIVGGAGGMLGAERIFAGAKGFKGNAISRALKTGASEGAQEFGEEFATQYEANRAVAPYDGRDPMQGAVAAGTLGALAGAPIGMLTGAVSPRREDEPKKPAPTPEQKAAKVLAAGSVDEAIKAAQEATIGKPAGGGLDRLRGILPDEQRREVIGLMATANNPNSPPNVRRFAEQQIDAILREYTDIPAADVVEEAELLPTPDAKELTDEERAAYVNAPSNLDRLRLRKPIPTGEATDAIPAADAQEIEPIPAGEASEEIPAPDAYEVPPVGEATEVIPTGDAMEVPRIPTGKATEIEPETVQADDLLTGDGMPYGSKTAANVRAKKEGLGPANVVEIPGAGWVVRPQPKTLGPAPINAQPAGTRGTTAADLLKAPNVTDPARTAGPRPADAGRGDGAGVLPVVQPGDVAAGAAAPSGQGVDGGGAAGPGGRGGALTPVRKKVYPDGGVAYDFTTNENMEGRVFVAPPGFRKGVKGYEVTLDRVGGPKGEDGKTKFYPTKTIGKYRTEAAAVLAAKKAVEDHLAKGAEDQAAPHPAKQGPTPQGATDEGLQRQGQGRREEVASAGAQAAAPAPVATSTQADGAVSAAEPMKRLGMVMRRAGWEIDYIDLDLTGEKPKADIRIGRNDGRFIIAKVDAQGRATMETFQRTRGLGIDPKNKQARLAPQIDDQFLGRQKFEGARSMLRGMVTYLTDNATNPVALADMKAAWAGVMAGPTEAAPALPAPADAAAPAETAPAQVRVPDAAAPAPTLADKIKQRRAEKAAEPAPPAATEAPKSPPVLPGAVATHKDPGEPAEPATAPVIAQALGKAARKEALSRAAMKANLLRMIDAALLEAPDIADFDAAVKSMGRKDAVAAFTDAKGTLGEKAAPKGYSRPTRTFKVEGDGTFTVQNTVRQLLTFRAKVEASPGFKDQRAGGVAPERATDALDRRATDAAIANMIDEGDFQAAMDYAAAKEVDIGAVKLSKVLRERLEKWQKDQESAKRMAEWQAAQEAGKPAPGSLAAMVAEKEAEAPAPQPEPDNIPEAGIASQTFDQWVRAKYNGNEYKASYLKEFGGDEKRAMLGAAVSTIDSDRSTADLLKAARIKYHGELMGLPREASISLEVWDALDNTMKLEAQRHFFDLDARITRRDQDATKARVEAEKAKKAPYEAAFAEVDAEIRRLDKLPGPVTKRQNELSARRDRLREALYQIGQGKEPDGRLLRPAPAPQPEADAAPAAEPAAEAPARDEAKIELRKRLSVLRSLKDCLA